MASPRFCVLVSPLQGVRYAKPSIPVPTVVIVVLMAFRWVEPVRESGLLPVGVVGARAGWKGSYRVAEGGRFAFLHSGRKTRSKSRCPKQGRPPFGRSWMIG